MGLEVEIDGAGGIGDITPGWTVQEYATPIVPGENAGGTGLVSFNAAARPDSLFLINNNVTSSVDGLGEISGSVKSVSQSGPSVAVTHGTALSIFDADFYIPALGAGGMLPVIDLASQLAGVDKLCLPETGYLYTMCGHSAGFDSKGNLAKASYTSGSYPAYDNGTATFYTEYYKQQYGSLWADSFASIDGNVYALNIVGDSFSNDPSLNISRLAFKAKGGEFLSWTMTALPDDSNTGSGQEITLSVDNLGQLQLAGRYRYAGISQDFLSSADLASSLNLNDELVFFIEYHRPALSDFVTSDYRISVQVCSVNDYENPVVVEQVFNTHESEYYPSWSMNGVVRDVYSSRAFSRSIESDWIAEEYAGVPTYVYLSDVSLGEPVAAQPSTNLWTYMQDACTVYRKEIASIDGAVIVRDIDTIELNVDNHTPISVAPSIVLSGRNVEVNYSNARHVANTELYNAYTDSNRVIGVKAGETVKTIVTVSGTISSINLPTYSASPTSGPGQYKISDSKGLPIPIKLWNDNGGKLEVSLVDGQPDAIEITFIGPVTTDGVFNEIEGNPATPQYPGPYKLAYTADGTDYAAFSIIGSGILTNTKTLKLRTAADADKTAQDIAKTVTSPFIATMEQAYDRGILVATDASGPKVVISGSVSINALDGFGLTAGSRVRYMDSIYRVTDVSYTSLGVSFNASRHVTVEDFDSLWNGRQVRAHDMVWDGYDASDHLVKPLLSFDDGQQIVLSLDADGNPYFSFWGVPTISMFFDVDGQPYYDDGDAVDGQPVYLDVDGVPYY